MIKIIFSALILSIIWSQCCFSNQLMFKLNGKNIKQYDIKELSNIIKPAQITIFEPHELRNRKYIGFPSLPVLKKIYKDQLTSNKDIYLTCTDGYKPSIPVVKFLKYNSYLVYKNVDNSNFTLINKNQNNEYIELKPFYLVWDNLKHSELIKGGAYDFPYQIESIDLISFQQTFPNMSPPISSSKSVVSGFVAYRKYCSTCHTINGQGGGRGVELNYPVNVTEYFDEKWLKKWIENPGSIRFNSKMPALNLDIDNKEKVISSIIEYLKVMKEKKIKPELN
jgi:cytochrome c2